MLQPTARPSEPKGIWVITAKEVNDKPGRMRVETPYASECNDLLGWLEAHPRWTDVEFTFNGTLTVRADGS